MQFRHFLEKDIKFAVGCARLGALQIGPLPGVDLGHASQVGGVVGEDVTAQAFFGRFALVRARGKESVDVRRGAVRIGV